MSGLDEAEYQKLAAAVESAEKIQKNGGSTPNGSVPRVVKIGCWLIVLPCVAWF